MRIRLLQSLLMVSTLSLAGSASAHFDLLQPAQSSNSDNGGKGDNPCGPDTTPAATPIPLTGGSMYEIKVDEFVPHPGHYRVALGLSGRQSFMTLEDPDVMDEDGNVITTGDSFSAVIQNPPVFPVIADNLMPHTSGGGMQSGMVAIPNVNCDNCVIQVIQFMAEHGPDYFYRHCADVKITADTTKPIFDPTGMGGGGSGGGGAGGAAGGGAGGAGTAGGGSGGVATAGSPSGGAPGGGGAGGAQTAGASTAGAATAGTGTGVTPPAAAAADDGGCTIASVGGERSSLAFLAGSLLLGLGFLARRRDRA